MKPSDYFRRRTRIGALALALVPVAALAQDAAAPAPSAVETIILGLLVLAGMMIAVFALLLLMVAVLVDYYLRLKFGRGIFPRLSEMKAWDMPVLLSWSKFTGLQGTRKQAKMDQLLDHDYDGIQELDNAAPPIFNYILVGTVAFAIGYLLVFHVFRAAPLQRQEYQLALDKAAVEKAERTKLAKDQVNEINVVLLTDAVDITAGQKIYTEKCVVCHGVNGEGLVGPNLSDPYWIHGGDVKDLFRVIKNGGRSGKGMISWQAELTPSQMAQVASYILKTFPGTTPANAKAPEGELYTPPGAAPAEATAADSANAVAGLR